VKRKMFWLWLLGGGAGAVLMAYTLLIPWLRRVMG
jgi:hypothetical protein